VRLFKPPVAFKITSGLSIATGQTLQMIGDALRDEYTIRAHASMAYMVLVKAGLTTDPQIVRLQGITFDGNQLADVCIMRIGDFESEYDHVATINAVRKGVRATVANVALTLGSVTPGSGAPAGVNISQLDTFYHQFNDGVPGVVHLVIKFTVAGGLGVGKFVLSLDGGSTFSTATQTCESVINLAWLSTATILGPLGVQLHFPSQTYPLNGTYSVNVTVNDNGQGTTSINADSKWYNLYANSNGTMFATAGIVANWGDQRNQTITGTAATISGSQVVTISGGPNLLTLGIEEGNFCYLNGKRFPIAVCLDSATFAIAKGSEPNFTMSGIDYAIGVGAGWDEDSNKENIRNVLTTCYFAKNPVGWRSAGAQGALHIQSRNELYGLLPMCLGSSMQNTSATYLERLHIEQGNVGSNTGPYLMANHLGGLVVLPPEIYFPEGPGSIMLFDPSCNMVPFGMAPATFMPMYCERTVTSAFNFTSAGLSVPAPSTNAINGHTSVVYVTSTAHFTLGGVPTIAQPAVDGLRIRLHYVGAFSLTLQPDGLQSTLLQLDTPYLTISTGDTVTFESRTLQWVLVGRTRGSLFNSIGQNGEGQRIAFATGAGAVELWKSDTVNAGVGAGTGLDFKVTAQARGGLDYAEWTGCHAGYDVAGNLVSFTVDTAASTAGVASNWSMTVNANTPFAQILFDPTALGGSNQVEIKVSVEGFTPPNY
jgi:hypothetical protein